MILVAIAKKTQLMVIKLLMQIFCRVFLAFVQNIYIMLEKNLYIYLRKINPEEVFQKNYLRTYVKSKH